MAKKKKSGMIGDGMNSVQISPDMDWQVRDDANRIMEYAALCADRGRLKRASKRLETAVRHSSRSRGKTRR